MANRKRKEKPIPAHLEHLPPAPDKNDGMEKSLFAKIKREGAANERRDDLMKHHQTEFSKTKNPLVVWDAYILARMRRKLIPDFVLEYFDEVANKMMKPGNLPEDLPEIMGFRLNTTTMNGGSQAFQQYKDRVVRQDAVGQALNYLKQHPDASISKACEHAGKFIFKKWGVKMQSDTIKRWYQKHK